MARELGKSLLAVRYDDDIYIYIYTHTNTCTHTQGELKCIEIEVMFSKTKVNNE